MKISLNWLRNYTNIPADTDPKELGHLFTIRTAEVEGVENQAENYDKIVTGKILEIQPHPNADKLKITKTTVGNEILQIVCGGTNIYEGMYVAVALIGAKVRWHGQGDLVTMEPAKIRGIESFGMICAGEEIGLEEHSDGCYDLTNLKPEPGTKLADLLEKNDTILTIDNKSLTHRPDCWGHYGIAREFSAILGQELKPLEPKIEIPVNGTKLDVKVENTKACPRYIGTIIENIKIEESPAWLKKAVTAIGYRSINNIVDLTNYVMADVGQPMHAFDAKEIEGGIIVRNAEEKEKFTTLDQTEHTLPKEILVIADHKRPVALAGIMGGLNSEITDKTTSIILESANFHPATIRKGSTKINLRTEAVQRYEKSLDPELCELAAKRFLELLVKIQPTVKLNPLTDVNNYEPKNITITVNPEKVCSKIGKKVETSQMISILKSLQFEVTEKSFSNNGTQLEVKVPSFRATKDVSQQDDIIEEIARLYGYDNIEPQLPALPIKLPLENLEKQLEHRSRITMSEGLGYNEVSTYSFYNKKDIEQNLLPEELHLKIENYLTEDQTHLRTSLVPNLLKKVAHNLKFRDQFKIYEIGRTYNELKDFYPLEEKYICALTVKNKVKNYEPFYEAKSDLEEFLNQMQITGNHLEYRKAQSFCPYAHPNKHAEIIDKRDNQIIARVLELHPLVAKNNETETARIALFEVNLSKINQLTKPEQKFKAIPKFPGIQIDVSVVINKKTEVGFLQKAISSVNKDLIKEVTLFDLYEGQGIPENQKSLAFKVYLQNPEKTLTDIEMKEVQKAIFDKLQKLGGTIRGL